MIGRNGHKSWRLKKNAMSAVGCTVVVGGINNTQTVALVQGPTL
jgi:hypothetical protein